MTNQSNQQAQLSWLQSSSGEWLYFLEGWGDECVLSQ